MPTARPRLMLTETDELARAIDEAAERWPDIASRRELVLRLIAEGRAAIAREDDDATRARRAAIRDTSGALTGVYEPGYLERIRGDWSR